MLHSREIQEGNQFNYFDNKHTGYVLGKKTSFSEDETVVMSIDGGGWLPIPLKELTGIPIDGSELPKLGFKNMGIVDVNPYEKYDKWILHKVYNDHDFEVRLVTDTYGGLEVKYAIFVFDWEIIPAARTKFVHNLQNCFFMVTNIGLEYNNKI